MLSPTALFDVTTSIGDDSQTIEVTGELLNEIHSCLAMQIEFRRAHGGDGVSVNSLMIAQLANFNRFIESAGEQSVDDSPMTKAQAIQLARHLKKTEPGLHKFRPKPARSGGGWNVVVYINEIFSFEASSPQDLQEQMKLVFSEDWR